MNAVNDTHPAVEPHRGVPFHRPCMLRETIEWLAPRPGQVIADLTVGFGGHARAILERIGRDGKLLGIEWDPETFAYAEQALGDFANVILVNDNFVRLREIMVAEGLAQLDGALLDAGVNWYQLTSPERSISMESDKGLDMRINRQEGQPAETIVNEADERTLVAILRTTLPAREARPIAAAIVRARRRERIRTTRQLAEIIQRALGPQAFRSHRQPYAGLLAFRIFVNRELLNLEEGIRAAIAALRPGGRFVGLSFHSAEYRVFRRVMRELAHPCRCDPRLPCTCGQKPRIKILTPKPLAPDENSLRESGPQCRSCRLHAAEALSLPP